MGRIWNIHEDDKTLSSGSNTPIRSPKRLDDNSSIVVIFISSDERRRVIQEFLRAHKIKVLGVKNIVELSQTLRELKQEQEKLSTSKSDLNKSFGFLGWPTSRSSNTSPKNDPLSLDEKQLPPSDLIIPMPVHGTRLNSLINLLPEFGDGNPSQHLTSQKLLSINGVTTTSCVNNGKKALDMVTKGLNDQRNIGASHILPYDYIFMDCQMPDMDGCEATKQIRLVEITYGVHIPIIGLTAHEEGEELNKMFAAGIDIYISKPSNNQKIQVAQKKFKKAFENADSSSRVELIPSKINSGGRRRVIQEFLRAHKIKVLAVKNIVQLSQTLRELKMEQEKVSSSKSDLYKSFDYLGWPTSRSSNTSPKNVPLSAIDGTDVSPTQSLVKKQLPPSNLIIPMPVHDTRLNLLINLLPEFGGTFPSTPPHQNQPTPREVEEIQRITRDEQTPRKQEGPTEITKSSPLRGKNVLLADDDPSQHLIAQKLLSRNGVTTTCCINNGKETLDMVTKGLNDQRNT
nr:histidine kinase CKI1-like [Tanacetum cinerariifolium]